MVEGALVYIYIYIYIYGWGGPGIYIYIYTHTHTHIYIYIYTHTHTHILSGFLNKPKCNGFVKKMFFWKNHSMAFYYKGIKSWDR